MAADLTALETIMPLGFVGWGFLAFLGILFVVFWWALASPGFRGIAHGVHIVYLYSAGGRLFQGMRGNLVDITDTHLSPILIRRLKSDVLLAGLKSDLDAASSDPKKHAVLSKTIKAIEDMDLQKTVKVYGMRRSRNFTKHLFVTFFTSEADYESFPDEYAAKSARPGFNIFTLDWMNRGLLEFFALPMGRFKATGLSNVQVWATFPRKLPTLEAATVENKAPELEAFTRVAVYAKDSVAYSEEKKRSAETMRGYGKLQQTERRKDIVYSTIIHNQEKALIHLYPGANPKKLLASLSPPRREPAMGAIIGVFLGGLLAQYVGGSGPPGMPPGVTVLLGAVIGAVLGLVVMSKLSG